MEKAANVVGVGLCILRKKCPSLAPVPDEIWLLLPKRVRYSKWTHRLHRKGFTGL